MYSLNLYGPLAKLSELVNGFEHGFGVLTSVLKVYPLSLGILETLLESVSSLPGNF